MSSLRITPRALPPLPAFLGGSPRPGASSAPASRPLAAAVRRALAGSLDGREGGPCKVFVERQLGAHFPGHVSAKSMVKPGNHPGLARVKAPRPGDVFVLGRGRWGHTGFVKAVHGDGSLTVVDSNWVAANRVGTHRYSAAFVKAHVIGYLRPDGTPVKPYWQRPLS